MMIDFGSLYERYAQDVYRFTLYLCGDPALAEDIAAETFVRAWVSPSTIQVSTVKAYLFMIARNLYRTELKRNSRQVELEDGMPDREPGIETEAGIRIELQEVLDLLQTLPELDRAVLLMHIQDGMPYVEIAAVLGLTVVAVKVKVHRSRIKINYLRNLEKNDERHP
jgi:RNA polymerase sigma-70 factor (ECF subfamily)